MYFISFIKSNKNTKNIYLFSIHILLQSFTLSSRFVFLINTDSSGINSIVIDGVNMEVIQALIKKTDELQIAKEKMKCAVISILNHCHLNSQSLSFWFLTWTSRNQRGIYSKNLTVHVNFEVWMYIILNNIFVLCACPV